MTMFPKNDGFGGEGKGPGSMMGTKGMNFSLTRRSSAGISA
jgi:hypothetical protein